MLNVFVNITEAGQESAPEVLREGHPKPSIAVQVNDYEIERRSGLLPARRRVIPAKFRYRCTNYQK